jgi:holin-like protein
LLVQVLVILAFLGIGELIVAVSHVPVPSSIIGMILLAAALKLGWLKFKRVDRISRLLNDNLGFFFIPAGVGIMTKMELLERQWLPIVVASVVSTVIILAVTGWVHQLVRNYMSRHHGISE